MMRSFFRKLEVFIRSFFIEASFNYESMQTWGFLFILVPFLRKKKNDRQFLENIEKEHKVFINTHPYMATFLAGAILHIEENSETEKEKKIHIDKFKKILSQSLAASGDRFFWKYLKPVCALFGVLILVSNDFSPLAVLTGVTAFLILFNLPALFFRIIGFYKGYSR